MYSFSSDENYISVEMMSKISKKIVSYVKHKRRVSYHLLREVFLHFIDQKNKSIFSAQNTILTIRKSAISLHKITNGFACIQERIGMRIQKLFITRKLNNIFKNKFNLFFFNDFHLLQKIMYFSDFYRISKL